MPKNKFEPKIAWEKCHNPFTTLEEKYPIPQNEEFPDDYQPEDFDQSDTRIAEDDVVLGSKVSAMYTPLGIVPLDEYSDAYKKFNFWTGHTNFGITQGMRNIISETPGVEVVHVFTRYRFRVAIGRVFKTREVLNEIQSRIRRLPKSRILA